MTNIQITEEILKSLDRQGTEVVKNKSPNSPEIVLDELIWSIIEFENTTNASEYLGISRSTISGVLKKIFNATKGPKTRDWRTWLIFQTDYKYCPRCKNYLLKNLFHLSNSQIDKLTSKCKLCSNEVSRSYYANNKEKYKIWHKEHYKNNKAQYISKDAKRRAAKLKRTVRWANLDKIKEMYKNCPEGYHVDHIIPLQGKTVSGLHVENNLQYLTAEANLKKGNKYEYN